MKAKILKAQFNEMCLGGMILDLNNVTIYSGTSKMNSVEITQGGINIQSEIGKPIILNSPTIYGPGYSYFITPADFVPFAHAALPRKTIAPVIGITEQFTGLLAVSSALALAGALR